MRPQERPGSRLRLKPQGLTLGGLVRRLACFSSTSVAGPQLKRQMLGQPKTGSRLSRIHRYVFTSDG